MKTKILIIISLLILVIPLLTNTAIANEPPSVPEIEGPSTGSSGVDIQYGFCSTDPEGQDLSFCIDWGEGTGEVCIGTFPSGTCANIPHTWENQGTYTIKAKARDTLGAESQQSTFTVKIPRNLYINIKFLEFIYKLLDNFPNIFPILQKLI